MKVNIKNGLVGLGLLISGYALIGGTSQAQAQITSLPATQQRVFYTDDVVKMMSKAIYTLQDIDYAINYIDFKKGKIYAESLRDWTVQTTISVVPDHKGHVFVGVSIIFGDRAVHYADNARAYDVYFKMLATNYIDSDI